MTNCRSCDRSTLIDVLDLGNLCVPDFRHDNQEPPRHPLRLVRCVACGLVQLSDTVPREHVYHDGYGFYSGINDRTRSELGDIVTDALRYAEPREGRRWLDIGCNDGTLLSHVPEQMYRVGVDPVSKFADLADEHADEVHVELFDPETFSEPFDVVTSIAMFYDLPDPSAFVRGIKSVLADDGLWVVQQNDLMSMMLTNAVDNISHEHLTYWSLSAFDRLLALHGMQIVEVKYSDLNGGCMRCFVKKYDSKALTDGSVKAWRAREDAYDLDSPRTYRNFRREAHSVVHNINEVVRSITSAGQTVYIYGASNRGSTLWQAAEIGKMITSAVERNPEKVGLNFSSIGVPIISEEQMRDERPDYLLVGPWWFADMFKKRERDYLNQGGGLIIPLPEVKVITAW